MSNTQKTQAEQISARYHDDGQRWRDADGVRIEEALKSAGATSEYRHRGDVTRYTLPDGSVLTTAAGGWDLGYTDCWCWAGAGHEDDCDVAAAAIDDPREDGEVRA